MILCRPRNGTDLYALAIGFGVSLATTQRYCDEGVRVLSEMAPDLADLTNRAVREGWAYAIVDGTLIRTDRVASKAAKHRAAAELALIRGANPEPSAERAVGDSDDALPDTSLIEPDPYAEQDTDNKREDKPLSKTKIDLMAGYFRADWRNDPTYSGKHHDHGMNCQVVCGPNGKPAYISPALPGRVYDSKAAEAAGLPGALAAAEITTLADLAYISLHGWKTPIKKKKGSDLTDEEHAYNVVFAGLRFAVERGMWLLVGHWRILRHNPGQPAETANIARACLVLNQFLDGTWRPPLRHDGY